ncbi:MAG: lipid-A-disaccharide synthase [Sphingobacteriia bacterium]|nr:lipid-A-disaccharide synthase [Sphingobacteriia bacterium]
MKVYCIAGEASGDLHGASLLAEWKRRDPSLQVRGWGGDLMQAQGMDLVKHYRETAFMGFAEVARNLRTILGLLDLARNDLQAYAPDVLLLIDYPGFNLRMARYAHALGIRVVYYISPQVWAWKEGRVRQIRQSVDLMLCILPFEKDWYAQRGMQVHYVGHPLADQCRPMESDQVGATRQALGIPSGPCVALLPGSRLQEIRKHGSLMLRSLARLSGGGQVSSGGFVSGGDSVSSAVPISAVLAMAPGVDRSVYLPLEEEARTLGLNLHCLVGKTRELLGCADAALVASGTATLEAALLGCPMVAVYRVHPLSYFIGKALVKVRFVSLVNLILDREAVPERLQSRAIPTVLEAELRSLLDPSSAAAAAQKQAFGELRGLLARVNGDDRGATAAARAADCIVRWAQDSRG